MAAKQIARHAESRVRKLLHARSTFGPMFLTLFMLSTGCAAIPIPARIALLAPFEGRYREVGYEALYAARLALRDTGSNFVELLPVDDGGTTESARLRAHALAADPDVKAVIVLGNAAADLGVLTQFADLPAIVVGSWGAQPIPQNIYILSNPHIRPLLTMPEHITITEAARLAAPMTGSEVLTLAQFRLLRVDLDGITILTSAALPDATFAARYHSSDPFAPEPRLLAALSYDAARMAAVAVLRAQGNRDAVNQSLRDSSYNGLNGSFRFENGYWADAPIHAYRYGDSGELLPIDHIIE